MKLSCKVIEDLLPMYYDGVCSEDSAALIETHLKECPQCSRILADLHTEMEIPQKPVDDMKPLAEICTEWKKEKSRSVKKGACIMLSVLLVLGILVTSVWYFGYAIHYDRLASKLEKIKGETKEMTTASHILERGDYMVVLKKPSFLGEGGFVHIGDKEGMVIFLDEEWNEVGRGKDVYVDLFFYPQFGGGYKTAVIFDDGHHSWWVWLTADLTYNYELSAEHSAEEVAYMEQLLKTHSEEIRAITAVAKEIWNIDLLQ